MENEKTEIISAKYITAETDHMAYQPGMDNIGSEIQDEVISRMNAYDADSYTAADVLRALRKEVLAPEDFAALLCTFFSVLFFHKKPGCAFFGFIRKQTLHVIGNGLQEGKIGFHVVSGIKRIFCK